MVLEFDDPKAELERRIIVKESGVDGPVAANLVKSAQMTRTLKGSGLDESASPGFWCMPAN